MGGRGRGEVGVWEAGAGERWVCGRPGQGKGGCVGGRGRGEVGVWEAGAGERWVCGRPGQGRGGCVGGRGRGEVGVWEAGAGERWVCPMYSVCIVAAQSLTEVLTTSCSDLLTRTNALTGFTIANAKYFVPLDPVWKAFLEIYASLPPCSLHESCWMCLATREASASSLTTWIQT